MTNPTYPIYLFLFLVVVSVAVPLLRRRIVTSVTEGSSDDRAVASLRADLPTLLADYDKYKRRADEYLVKIDEVIAERDTWRDLYNDQAGGHENAQIMMLSALTAVTRAYNQETGKVFKLDPILELVSQNWMLEHGQQARDKRGENGQPQVGQTEAG